MRTSCLSSREIGTSTLNWVSKFLKYTLLVGATLYIIVYLILALSRIGYPFELECLEGCSMEHVRRILSGQKLYVSPSIEFVPFVYTPLYFYLSAVMSKILGIGLMPLRLVSFISSIGCFFVIFLIVNQETGSKFSSILAGCLFAATFQISGAWFDIARVDSLFLFLLLVALYLVKFKKSLKSYIFAGVLIAFSFLVKQTALVISLPIMLYCALSNRRYSIFFIGTIVAIIGISTLFLNYIHDGWYNYYIFYLPGQQYIVKRMFVHFWTKDLMGPLSIACIMSLSYIFIQLLRASRESLLFYSLAATGMIGGSWVSRVHSGCYANVLFPAYATISILFGLATHTAFEFIQSVAPNKQNLMKIYVYLICIIQFACLKYNPYRQIPTQKDLQAGKELINMISSIQGDVIVPCHGYLPPLAGKKSYAQNIAIVEVLKGQNTNYAKTNLTNEIRDAIREKEFSAIILDAYLIQEDMIIPVSSYWFQEDIDKYYTKRKRIFDSKNVFWPVTGTKIRPQFIYTPKPSVDNRQ